MAQPDPTDLLREGRAIDAEAGELVAWLRNRTVALRTALERSATQIDDLTRERDDLRARLDTDNDEGQDEA